MALSTWSVDHYEIGAGDHHEIGVEGAPLGVEMDNVEVGAAAVREVVRKARDNRQPPPRMRAVDADAPEEPDLVEGWFSNIALETSEMIGVENAFPLMTKLLTRFGAGQEKPRYVRVDTEESYQAFLASCSPEMAAVADRVAAVADKLEEHIHDPYAHEDLIDEIDEVEMLGAEAASAHSDKEIELWLPQWAQGKVRAWKEGDCIVASICLPGVDGNVRICSAVTPVDRAVEEMENHAASADVDAADIVGVIPAMGCVLGAGTLVKEMAAAAPSILQRPEAATGKPFLCRIEPKASPAICAFIALAQECARGDTQACAEWNALADAAGKGAPPVAQAMREAAELCKKLKAA